VRWKKYLRLLNQGTCRSRMDITLEDFWSQSQKVNMVGAPGFEPGTSCAQGKLAEGI
jgi:hypothetical protein